MSDSELYDKMDGQLQRVASGFAYPPTPDLAGAERRRLARQGASQQSVARLRLRPSWGLAIASSVLLFAALLAVPEVQAFVRQLFSIGSVRVVVATPTTGMPATPEASATPARPLNLVGETTLSIAKVEFPHPIMLPAYPADIGWPDRVFIQDVNSPALILAWTEPDRNDQARMVLYEISGPADGEKVVADTRLIEETTVNGKPAAWLTGSHWLQFYDTSGMVRPASRRLVDGNVLLWEDGGITYRLESDLSIDEAVRVAESLRVAEGIEPPSRQKTATPPDWARNLAGATTLAEAGKRVSFPIRWPSYPSYLGEPDLAFLQERAAPMAVVAWYVPGAREKVRILLYQMALGDAAKETYGGGDFLSRALVNGNPARWVSGPHLLSLYDEGGGGNLDAQRHTVSNALIWEENGVAYRLETPMSLSEAVRVAESVNSR